MRKIIVFGIMFFLLSNIFVITRETSSFDNEIDNSILEVDTFFVEEQNQFISEAMDVELRWMIELDYECSILEFLDYNYDGYLDILSSQDSDFGPEKVELFCLKGDDGSINWEKDLYQNQMNKYVCVCDIDNDGIQEIIFKNNELYCYDVFGNFKWQVEQYGDYNAEITVIDANNDGFFEIFMRAGSNVVKISHSGSIVWTKDVGAHIIRDVSFADIDNAGGYNIVVPVENGNLICLDSSGNIVWTKSYSTYEYYWNTRPTIADISVTAGLEILLSGSGGITCLDCNGNILWNVPNIYNTHDFQIQAADINNDNKLEIITNTHNKIYCFDNLGNQLWEYAIFNYLGTNPLIADLNGDGYCEILASPGDLNDPNELLCIDYLGNLVWSYGPLNGIVYNSLILDVDLDGILEIVFILTYKDNIIEGPSTIYCLNLVDVTSSGIQPWSTDSCSTYNTGCIDTDGDSIDDFTEDNWASNENKYDTDSDTMHDGIEFLAGLNPTTNDLNSDLDSDGLTNNEELFLYHTNVRESDPDGDNLNDYEEVVIYNTNPSDADTDNDELNDYDEIFVHFTNATNFDSEGDSLPDGFEIQYGFNPWVNDSYLDQDNDNLTAYEEYLAGGSPFSNDTDSDGLSDYNEYHIHGTDAGNDNTDGDMMGDFWEVMYGTNPLVDDSLDDPDADFLVNFEEYDLGTDPLNRDTDGDGFGDGDEINKGYDPLDPESHPPIPPSPSVKLGISTFTGIVLAFLILSLFIGVLTKKKLKLKE